LAVVATLVVLSAARTVANILILVVVALVLAVGLEPVIRRLQGLGLGRGPSTLVLVPSPRSSWRSSRWSFRRS
jgi:predicted PurR-regulated permease PerM